MNKTVFISGHRDITKCEFEKHYKPKIFARYCEQYYFIMGDCLGVDIMAQKYLMELNYKYFNVYHIGDNPMNSLSHNNIGGFVNDIERDFEMTKNSIIDIAWIRPGKERSGTQKNIIRRKLINDNPKLTLYELYINESMDFI